MVKGETEAPAQGRKPAATATSSTLDKCASPRLYQLDGFADPRSVQAGFWRRSNVFRTLGGPGAEGLSVGCVSRGLSADIAVRQLRAECKDALRGSRWTVRIASAVVACRLGQPVVLASSATPFRCWQLGPHRPRLYWPSLD